MSYPLRIERWQSTYATRGGRYRLAFLAQGSTVITTGTTSEFKRVLDNRVGVSVDRVQLLGRVMSADVSVDRSASFLWLFGDTIVAGTPATTFKLVEVYDLGPGPSLAQTIGGAIAGPYEAGKTAGSSIANAVGNTLGGFLPDLGGEIGQGLAGVIKPLLLPAVLVLVGMYLYGKRG